MESVAAYIYPQVVWREDQKMLWNPIHRKPLKNRPEERVRLRIIEFLLSVGWSKHRISTEEAIGTLADSRMRTDIICYNREFEPRILIECKAEHVPISRKAAEQVARYNQNVGAPYLLMSNGRADFWYAVRDSRVDMLEKRPEPIGPSVEQPTYHFEGWHRRGFAGSEASPELRKWLSALLPGLWHSPGTSDIRFLTFNQELTDLNLNHYYVVHPLSGRRRLALSTLTTAYGGSRLVAILNEDNQNRAVLEVNLDLLFDGKAKNSTMYSEAGVELIDAAGFLDRSPAPGSASLIKQVKTVFGEYAA
ncbi:Type I restriction enzyme R protein N terminus (HSDR_N) [Fodinibius roseus]|uniref:Type I restriction enzyme R protein N terminus (HSDR_N) n=1 Tax=Fodinibius roseus TaxID=1194090 RepID=A0A1M4ZUM4_9BACT|nr:type I restriction enzyme HsdR N-terminal domain-containing protein [Fodinibius roseus]SHF21671.1 Type I restriction enzyme R protein N terminus (HSDR_N) [Fodinibius roseus]